MRTARRSIGLVNIAKFRMGAKQLSLRNRRLIEAATARCDVAEEGIRNRGGQGIPHREVRWIQLIEIQTTRQSMHTVIAYISNVNHIVRRGGILNSIHPLLAIVGLAAGANRAGAKSYVGQVAQ